MKVLLTGATGYIGKRLLPLLLRQNYEIVICVRDRNRFDKENLPKDQVEIIEVDFLNSNSLTKIPEKIDAAYYLIHSMSSSSGNFETLEEEAAQNFTISMNQRNVSHVVYLSGIVNDNVLSKHLKSRYRVEEILASGSFPLTTLRAGIIVGSGSASFEIIRDLVEKLPIMVAPRWLKTKSQPLAVRNVLQFLLGVLFKETYFHQSYDIGGPDILSYKEMLLKFAKVRGLKRSIFILPVMTPKLSSYWLYFVTSTSYNLAINLVDSMKVEVVCRANDLADQLGIELLSYEDAVEYAFRRIKNDEVLSSWTDAQSSDILREGITRLVEVPEYGCYEDKRDTQITDIEKVLENIWTIGGEKGWYSLKWLWNMRGFMDKLVGGVGLRRGRTHATEISVGDSLDFWRVLYADKDEMRLLLYAEMKLPGEAWLEFRIEGDRLYQTATFRPLGLLGRFYWLSILPFHVFIFDDMIKNIGGHS